MKKPTSAVCCVYVLQALASRSQAQTAAQTAAGDADGARRQAEEAAAARGRAEGALQQLQQQHEALQAEHLALRKQVRGMPAGGLFVGCNRVLSEGQASSIFGR